LSLNKRSIVCYNGRMDELQEALRKLEAKGWTLAAIADELGSNRVTVSRWMSGSHTPNNVKAVVMMLNALDRRRRIPKQRRYTMPRRKAQPVE